MNLESFLICDAATDSNGKLNVLGAFDTLITSSLPATHPMCAIVIRIRGKSGDSTQHNISMIGVDDLGEALIPKFEGKFIFPQTSDVSTSAVNFILNFQNLKFAKYGTYTFKLRIDDTLIGQIPLYAKPVPIQEVSEHQV